jgi:tetratricopeptide (TPR) repeat protein
MTGSLSNRRGPGSIDSRDLRGPHGVWRRRVGWLIAMAITSGGELASAHPDTWHTIELISAQMATGDRRAALFYARGMEYRLVERWSEAETDLRECLRQEPGFFAAARDLGPVLLSAGRLDDALEAARLAIECGKDRPPAGLAVAWVELARIQEARCEWTAVMAATDAAFRLVPKGEVDWYLLRERAWRSQGLMDQAIAELARGAQELRSTRLQSAWVDAQLEDGRAEESLATIERALRESRFRAPWLIRRARAHSLLRQPARARSDAVAALRELDDRLVPEEPDPTLLVQKGLALVLLDRREEAATQLRAAQSLGPPRDTLAPLELALVAVPPAPHPPSTSK